ncbi:hypothetical protein NRIC_27440 [Enterococcus florum]|uniref:DNA-directed RNA polymerase beta subunit n=1 Tax=Enterococcus florum TaxID=2480627 RepID=A0A4P5PNX7_9ENTE|nr:hypothetical protein [Enterococcus florum]GCF94853.1 hypothetical protein NRIC_27440 [Enterococcus florum]
MYDDESAREIFLEAKREYKDRGMMKWIGFYLSDHTALLAKDNQERYKHNPQKEQQDLETISDYLSQSYLNDLRVAIQLEVLDSEHRYLDDLIGKVIGQKETRIYLQTEDAEILHIELDQIRNVTFLAANKLWPKDVQRDA